MGKSSSSSANSTSTLNMTSQTDNRLAVGDGGFGVTGSNNVATLTMIDPGALKAMESAQAEQRKAMDASIAAANSQAAAASAAASAQMAAAQQQQAQAAKTSSDAFGFATGANEDVFSFARTTDASNKSSFSDLLSTSFDMFDRSYDVLENLTEKSYTSAANTQELTAQAYQTATAEKSGSIDNKTIAIIAVAGAAAFVLARKG